MKKWFNSPNGAVTLAALALLAFIGYVLMEMRYFLAKWIPGDNAAMVETVLILLIIGGWLRALFFAAAGGKRGGMAALLAFCVFTALIAPYDVRYFPLPWPEETMVAASFILPVFASVVLVYQLRRKRS